MTSCEALVTKAELNALKAELNLKANKSEITSIVQGILGAAGFATVGQLQLVKGQVTSLASEFPPIKSNVVSLNSKLQLVSSQASTALTAANTAQAAIANVLNVALAALSVGTFLKGIIDQKADQIQMQTISAETKAAQEAADFAFSQAIKARQEAKSASGEAYEAQKQAQKAQGTADLAIALTNQANAAAQTANVNAIDAKTKAGQAQAAVDKLNVEVKKIQGEIEGKIAAINQQIQAVQVEINSQIAIVKKLIDIKIGELQNSFTLFKAEILGKLFELSNVNKQSELSNTVTTLKGKVINLDNQITGLKSSLDTNINTLKSSVNTNINTLKSSVTSNINTLQSSMQSSINSLDGKFSISFQSIDTTIQKKAQEQAKQQQQELAQMNEQQFQQLDQKLTTIDTKLNQPQKTEFKPQDVTNIIAGVALIPAVAQVATQILSKVSDIKPTPCLAPVYVPPVGVDVKTNLAATNILQGVTIAQGGVIQASITGVQNVLKAMQPVLNGVSATVNTINTGLNTLTTFTQTAFRATRMDKVLNALNTILALHNAAMLSRNLAASIGDAISAIANNTLSFIKNEEDNSININEIVGNTLEGFLTSLLGTENYQNLSETFSKYNRIVNSAANIIWSIQSITAGLAEGLQIMGKYTGQIGNGLKKSGAVLENSYQWMSETFSVKTGRLGKIQEVLEGAEQIENVASEIQNATEEFRSAQENVNQINEQFSKVKQEITDKETTKASDEATNKTNSEGSQPTIGDYVPDPKPE